MKEGLSQNNIDRVGCGILIFLRSVLLAPPTWFVENEGFRPVVLIDYRTGIGVFANFSETPVCAVKFDDIPVSSILHWKVRILVVVVVLTD